MSQLLLTASGALVFCSRSYQRRATATRAYARLNRIITDSTLDASLVNAVTDAGACVILMTLVEDDLVARLDWLDALPWGPGHEIEISPEMCRALVARHITMADAAMGGQVELHHPDGLVIGDDGLTL
jgi:hypothetical protein